jgi:hypothetical protein
MTETFGHSDNFVTLSQALSYNIRETITPLTLRAGHPRTKGKYEEQ